MKGLRIEGLTVSYGRRRVVEGLDLPPLMPGEIAVLAGPNAAGKSTLLKGIAGLLPVRGRVMFGGRDLAALSTGDRAQTLGFMPQTLPSGAALSV
ncbi:ABC transporter ATP-binding protein, partial [Paracoccus sp. (in: a-proteobacteria)]|uniref:ATP-binding cassette domain-containing protein n=1 Tax=Paracoccus sp. TaxID=267 RepID=UPI0026DEE8A6